MLRRDFAGRMDLLRFSLQEIAQERLGELAAGSCVCHRGRFVLLLRCGQEQAVSLLSEIMDTVRMYLKLSTKAVLTEPAQSPADLPALYQRALLLLEDKAAAADGLFLLAEEEAPSAEGMLAAGLPGEVAQLLRAGTRRASRLTLPGCARTSPAARVPRCCWPCPPWCTRRF